MTAERTVLENQMMTFEIDGVQLARWNISLVH